VSISTGARKKALVVGISDYTNLQKLDFCKNDGKEVYDLLTSLGYEIADENKLIGKAMGAKVKDTIYDFFDDKTDNPDDTLLFYYSGHGVPGDDGNIYLASSDTDPDKPYRRGFSFEELRMRMQNTIPTKVVVILDCCYSGSAKISKGSEDDAAKMGRIILEEKSRKLPEGQGKYILSSSQSHQEAYALTTGEHSIFTYYSLKGLKGNTESIDSEGNVTPQSLGNYVTRAIMSLPLDERPKQRPMLKTEESGNVILASYPDLRSPPPTAQIMPISSSPPTKSGEAAVHKGILRSKTKISVAVGIATVITVVFTLALFNYYNHPTTNLPPTSQYALVNKGISLDDQGNRTGAILYYDKALAIDPKFEFALYDKGDDLYNLGNYTQAIQYLDQALAIDPNDKYALNDIGRALNGLGNNKEAITYQDKALAIDPKYEDALEDKGDDLNYLGNYTQALQYLDKVLAIDPNDKYALNDKGWALDGLGKYNEAITYLDRALAIDPNYNYALNNKGWALNGLGNYTQAITYLDKALAIDPEYKWTLYNKALALNSLGNYTGAIRYLDKALAIDPKFEDALDGKGDVLNSLGNYTGAIAYFNKALAINPHDKFAIDRLAQANRLHQLTQAKH
jgi:tetratricopeptide (TPR) repeat protein